jgi:hypothetical protein
MDDNDSILRGKGGTIYLIKTEGKAFLKILYVSGVTKYPAKR